ncbi:MAG TPA: nucleotidyltransferase family protein [bacterium]|nr:nucleotidyltransferase family protein [bacterium]
MSSAPWREAAERIGKNVDREKLITAIRAERLGGAVYCLLKANGTFGLFSSDDVSILERVYQTYKARNLLFADELAALARIFEAEKIPAVVIKGANCLRLCYADKGMRGMDDVDIVVDADAFESVRTLLLERGYRGAPYDRDFVYAPSGALFDLHRDPFDTHRIRSRKYYLSWDMRRVWERSEQYKDECRYVRCLTPVDEIIVSSIHAAKHSFSGLSHLLDIALLVREYGEDTPGDLFIERANSFGGKRAVYFALTLVDRIFGARLYSGEYGSLLRKPLNGYEKRALDEIHARMQNEMLGTILPFFEIDGAWRKVSYVIENVFPRPSVIGETYAASGFARVALKYPYRLYRLIAKGAGSASKTV